MPGGKRGNRNRNRKLQSCRVIFVGSPPHNTTINTRHTAPHQPNTNHHQQPQTPPPLPITATNTQHQPSTPRPASHAQPAKPSRASQVPASRPRSLLVARAPGCVLLAALWAISPASQPASQPASRQRAAGSGQRSASQQLTGSVTVVLKASQSPPIVPR